MNRWLYTVVLLVAGSAAAETAELENADCTKMKTYKLRTECLEAQGKTIYVGNGRLCLTSCLLKKLPPSQAKRRLQH